MTRKLLVVVASLVAAGFAAVAGEAAVTTNVTIPSEFTFIDPCTNESVLVFGDVHLVISSTVTDNTITSHTHSDFKATGVGLSSGMQYQLVSIGNGVSNASLQNGEFVSMTGARINIVTPGVDNNQWGPIALHSTFDADGNLKSFRFDFPPLTCR